MTGFGMVVPLLVGITLILMALRQLGGAARKWRTARALRSWPTVTGEITHSRVKYNAPYDDPDYSHAYEPEVYFHYTVDGRTYSTTEFVDREPDLEENVRAIVDRYPVGQAVTVHYDPANPRSAVLEPQGGHFRWQTVVVGLVELLTGVVMIAAGVIRIV